MFNYALPRERIAQYPVSKSAERHDARMLWATLSKESGELCSIQNKVVCDLPDILKDGDLLVLNDSRVIHARFFARLPVESGVESGVEQEIEVLLVKKLGREPDGEPREDTSEEYWEAMAKPMRKVSPGDLLCLSDHLEAEVEGRTDDGRRLVLKLRSASGHTDRVDLPLSELIEIEGVTPIPPYIRDGRGNLADSQLYQTVFAKHSGSVASPTAGLHFSSELLASLELAGIEHCFVTLHVGPGSFMPVEGGDLDKHQMQSESYCITEKTCSAISKAKREGRRVVAVGTTSVRALESAASEEENLFVNETSDGEAPLRSTSLFIKPGFCFKVVDSLITNFHQPNTTHLAMLSALVGEAPLHEIYQHALGNDYRFLSYGDAVFLDRQS